MQQGTPRKQLPKPAAFFVYGNGFVPTEDQFYEMLRCFKRKHKDIVTDDHIVGVPTQGESSVGAWKTSKEFRDETEMRAFIERRDSGTWASLLKRGGLFSGARRAMIVVAVWDKSESELANSCLGGTRGERRD